MATSRDKTFQQALALELHDRAALATLLIDSLEAETEQDIDEAWMREIERRAAAVDSGAVQTIPWGVARARLKALREAARVGIADVEAGRYRKFDSPAKLRQHLRTFLNAALSRKRQKR